jgi:hypothetical protein
VILSKKEGDSYSESERGRRRVCVCVCVCVKESQKESACALSERICVRERESACT